MTSQSLAIRIYEWFYIFGCYFLYILYILLILTLIKYRKTDLSSQFYRFFLFLSCSDIIRATVWHLGFDLPRWAWFSSFYHGATVFPTVMYTISGYVTQLSRVVNILLGVNRLTALAWPHQHEMWWSGRTPLRCILGSLLLAAVLNSHYWFITVLYGTIYVPTNGTGLAMLTNKPLKFHYDVWFAVNAVQGAAVVPIYIVLYGITFWMAYKRHKQVSPAGIIIPVNNKTNTVTTGRHSTNRTKKMNTTTPSQQYKIELRLALAMFLLCLFQIAYSLHMLGAVLFRQAFVLSDVYFYYVRLATVWQLDSLINPVLLLAMSKITRKCLKNLLNCSA